MRYEKNYAEIRSTMKIPRYYLDYIVHYLVSHSRHGTHSPFVYRLLEDVIYAPKSEEEPVGKVERLIARIADRFGRNTVYRIGTPLPNQPLDVIVSDMLDGEALAACLQQLRPSIHKQTVLVISGIYRNGNMKRLWQDLQKRPDVTVTIDLFRLGLVFFHDGQAKEHFRIRF